MHDEVSIGFLMSLPMVTEIFPGSSLYPYSELLGLFIFCIVFNGAGPVASKDNIGDVITQPLNRRKPLGKAKKKFVVVLGIDCSMHLIC